MEIFSCYFTSYPKYDQCDPKSDPRPEGLAYASGGGGASNRQGNVRVVEENKASQEEENDRLRMSNASYFYKISYNVYGELN